MSKVEKKLVRLRNVELIIHGCIDAFNLKEKIKDAWAIIRLEIDESGWSSLEVGGKEIRSLSEIPDTLKNTTLEITDIDARIVVYYPDKKEICIGFTDGEYAYMPCVSLDEIKQLLKHGG